jgi:glycerol-3-phosphate acyltransferase PlsX
MMIMHIALDAMGSDNHPEPELEAIIEAASRWKDPIYLTGPEDLLHDRLKALNAPDDLIKIVHAPEVLTMSDKPARAAKGKASSSMAVGIDLIKQGVADAFVTAGNTGGAMANGLFRLGRIRGLKRPGLATVFPVQGGQSIIIDIGANADCKPRYLLQFAKLGSVYAQIVLGRNNPRIGLISNGEEAGKGNELVKDTYPLLEKSGLNFIGNIEPKEFFAGEADVAVTDGFTGNILVKTSESVASFMIDMIRNEIRATTRTSLGGLLARPAFQRIAETLDPAEYGAAPLLGIRGLVFVGHGRSNAKAIANAIRVARESVSGGLLEAQENAIKSNESLQKTPEEVH